LEGGLRGFTAMAELCKRLAEALREIKIARSIHLEYAEKPYKPEYTGRPEWHKRWVKTYDEVLELLEELSRREKCP